MTLSKAAECAHRHAAFIEVYLTMALSKAALKYPLKLGKDTLDLGHIYDVDRSVAVDVEERDGVGVG